MTSRATRTGSDTDGERGRDYACRKRTDATMRHCALPVDVEAGPLSTLPPRPENLQSGGAQPALQ